MNQLIQSVIDHKEVIIPFLGWAYSEFLSLNPKLKSNGIVQLIGNLFKKGE